MATQSSLKIISSVYKRSILQSVIHLFLQGRGLFQIGLCRANQGCRTRMKSHQFCIIALFLFF